MQTFRFAVTGTRSHSYDLRTTGAERFDGVRAEMAAMYAPARLRKALKNDGYTGPITWTTRGGMTVTVTRVA
jgi:hypothetical protein